MLVTYVRTHNLPTPTPTLTPTLTLTLTSTSTPTLTPTLTLTHLHVRTCVGILHHRPEFAESVAEFVVWEPNAEG
jgi:hypothetical protein